MRMKWIKVWWAMVGLILVWIFLPFSACTAKTDEGKDGPAIPVATLANVPGRHFSSLSVHGNSEEILFLEFRDDLPSVSRLLRYHLKTEKLQYYDLPVSHVYLDAAFSPSGNMIVLRRAPNVRGNEEVKRQAYSNSEIVTMKADGTALKIVPLSPGLKMGPAMSHDEKRIAYWTATQRPQGSKSFATRFNVMEANLETETEDLFAGEYDFFEGGPIQYTNDDKRLLLGAGVPMSWQMPARTSSNFSDWLSDYTKKTKGSGVYFLKRGDSELRDAIILGADGSRYPSADANENVYFEAHAPKISFFKTIPNSTLAQWQFPGNSIGYAIEIKVTPNGRYFTFLYDYDQKRRPRPERGVAVFDIERGTWTQLSIPSLVTAISVPTVQESPSR